MIIIDSNILLYAANLAASEHERASAWLEQALVAERIGLPWVSLWSFLRIATNARLFPRPIPAREAFKEVRAWLELPSVTVVQPGPHHAEILEKLVTESQAAGPLVSDAVLAALAMEYGAVLASTDNDFRRFPTLRWINPLEPSTRRVGGREF